MKNLFSVSLNLYWYIFLLAGLLSIGITYFYYRIVVPQIDKSKKITLIFLRALVLFILILLLFEPILTVKNKFTDTFFTYVFIDNSESMFYKDSNDVRDLMNKFIDDLNNSGIKNVKFFNFGRDIRETNILNYGFKPNSNQTNFENISRFIKKSEDKIGTAIILSDGNINSGTNSTSNFTNLGLPIFTVGFTDTLIFKDISIKNIRFNTNIYKGDNTTISAAIYNSGFTGKSIKVRLNKEDEVIEEKTVTLSQTNIDRISFNYIPSKSGDFNFTINTDVIEKESNKSNNKKHFQLNILENKLRIVFISDSPTNDFTILKSSAESDTNRIISSYININETDKYLSNPKINIDSADVLFFVGFPTKLSRNSNINFISNLIKEKRIPFFFLLNGETDLSKANSFVNLLPFDFHKTTNNKINIQADFNSPDNFLITSKNSQALSFWNNLPPIQYFANNYSVKGTAKIIAFGLNKSLPAKVPLILCDNSLGIKSFVMFGENIWRWKLQNSKTSKQYFDSFIDNIIKWLVLTDSNNNLIVNTDKSIYFRNEEMVFTAELYDEKLQPIEDGEINLALWDNSKSISTVFSPTGNGRYELNINSTFSGEVKYKASYKKEDGSFLIQTGKVIVNPDKVEFTNVGRNKAYLSNLAEQTSGEYFESESFKDLILKIKLINTNQSNGKIITTKFNLLSNYFPPILIVLLLSLEWFIRKTNHLK
ncbi:MAG: hypothetical protein CO129_10130 [Ignavibacteriales bacterium CG_4_9_14_3_um_filter_34_10]|nr:MAG: hypothetical protein CO129_10130 [Ignavibacteriales bacterium CG_4_9_14_3_um_filter_34_10]